MKAGHFLAAVMTELIFLLSLKQWPPEPTAMLLPW
jgi:hypothetical protein